MISVAEYYDRVSDYYYEYGGAALGWHLGLWDESTADLQAAILRSNALLGEAAGLAPGMRVLDAGCGSGGLAIFLAKQLGVEVVGITICARHVERATRNAEEHGVEGRVSFRELDFMALDFEDESFDVVLNQESFCYTADKARYLADVRRVLRPGGRWACMDGCVTAEPLPPSGEELHRATQAGWVSEPFLPKEKLVRTLADAGYEQIEARELTPMALPTARMWVAADLRRTLRNGMGLAGPREADPVYRANFDACAAYAQGLLDGYFDYVLVKGRKPAKS